MQDNQLIVKPSFDGDITAQIKTVGEITSNIEKVKKYAESLEEYYKNIVFTEESISVAKEEKQKINKFKNEISQHRKEIVAKFNEPIKRFETLGKETEAILTNAYNTINTQVKNYEDYKKEEKENEVRSYFNEYKASHNLDFINYEKAKINVTLSASMKSLKQQAKEYIDKILDDIQLINSQPYREEIIVEYKQTLNASKSITTVLNRMEMLKREKEIQEKQKEEVQELKRNLSAFEDKEKVETAVAETPILEAPREEVIELKEVKILTSTFTVKGTLEQLKALKEFIQKNGIELV